MHCTAPLLDRRLLSAVAALALAVGCRDASKEQSAAAPDSLLARDLAMAQRQVAPETVFNDAPIGGTTTASPAPASPSPRPGPTKVRSPKPTPSPRPQSVPAPVARAPRSAPPQAAPVAQDPTPAAAPASTAGIIGVGSHVGMTINGRVCTLSALAGDKFTATVSSATVGSNGALIPAGSTVVLEVTSVERRDPVESSEIHFHVRAIDVNGESYPADGDVATLGPMETERVSGGSDRTKVVGGAIAGAVLGKILGRSTKATVIGAAAGAAAGTAAAKSSQKSGACLPEGSSLRLTLSREIVMRREGPI